MPTPQVHGRKPSHSVCSTGFSSNLWEVIMAADSWKRIEAGIGEDMKLTVKQAEKVATSAWVGDDANPAGPWKEAKPQCL